MRNKKDPVNIWYFESWSTGFIDKKEDDINMVSSFS